jgi:hypothetical protein
MADKSQCSTRAAILEFIGPVASRAKMQHESHQFFSLTLEFGLNVNGGEVQRPLGRNWRIDP